VTRQAQQALVGRRQDFWAIVRPHPQPKRVPAGGRQRKSAQLDQTQLQSECDRFWRQLAWSPPRGDSRRCGSRPGGPSPGRRPRAVRVLAQAHGCGRQGARRASNQRTAKPLMGITSGHRGRQRSDRRRQTSSRWAARRQGCFQPVHPLAQFGGRCELSPQAAGGRASEASKGKLPSRRRARHSPGADARNCAWVTDRKGEINSINRPGRASRQLATLLLFAAAASGGGLG